MLIGGVLGYWLLTRLGTREASGVDHAVRASACHERSRLEALFGPRIWDAIAGKTVIDFGCGDGTLTVELARHGASRVIGIDIRESMLELGRRAAAAGGVSERCHFTTTTTEPADVIFSIDGFEHYSDPRGALAAMQPLLKPDGRIFISFGPPWYHPLGGHLFSIFPWAHLVFTERALLRWRSDFKTDGATRFGEVEGGLNGMTVRRFRRLVETSRYVIEHFDTVPIRPLRAVATRLTREFTTSLVQCCLTLPATEGATNGQPRETWSCSR